MSSGTLGGCCRYGTANTAAKGLANDTARAEVLASRARTHAHARTHTHTHTQTHTHTHTHTHIQVLASMVRLAFHDAGPHNVSWNPFAKGPNGAIKIKYCN
jgi:hypothetical protein